MPEDTGFSMPPPSMTSAPRSATGANNRGRKRKNDSSKPQPDDNSFSKVTQSSKRERLSSSKTETSDTQKTSQNTNPDIWDVRVPVISLIDGSLIYGDKAPQRRSLESWLDANPNYMPYSVEMEDRAIYNRVASARGQDTSNMEALAYKHYLNSLLASAASGLHGGVSNSGVETSNSQSSGASQANNFNTQQYLQQQQLLSTFGAYARHPAYANIIASALNTSATGSTSGAKSRVPVTTSCAPSTTRSSKSRSAGNRSENSNRRRDSTEIVDSSTSQAYSFAPERTTGNTPVAQGNPFQMSTGNQRVDSMLAAVYQQAAAMNLAYMCNPLTAAALYSQIMLSCSGSANTADIGSSSLNLTSNAPSNQATLASLYANFLLSAKQMQQRQVSQSPGHWDTQQLLTSLAATLASACGSTGEIDTATLLSMFSGAASPSPGMGTTSTPVKHSNIQQQQQPCTQPDNRIHSITTSLASASDLTGSVCSERETQDSGDIRQTVSCRHSDKSQDKYDATKEYEESQTILDLSK
ncbi:unnamed protein product [Heterobilharzia americana]|nr:unnamed protein product [Heterobilharzia americana]